jgi:MFS family permease
MFTQGELGLLTVSAVFGLGFSGVIPAYVLAVRELFPPHEASWRIPAVFLGTGTGMATGGWLAGYLYDYFGYYAPAFGAGVIFNMINLVILGVLVGRQRIVAEVGR